MLRRLYDYLGVYGPKKVVVYIIAELKMILRGFFCRSFSQNGEDVLIDNLLGNRKTGFYVDVGAYHPTRLSNTKRFYLRGWNGINIEPDPQKIKRFYKSRPKDVSVNVGIANKKGKLTYFKFEPETLSTFSPKAAEIYKKDGFNLVGTSKVDVAKLSEVLSRHVKGKKIDFISIDVEGLDLEVLQSNDWKKFKPRLICVEATEKLEKQLDTLLSKEGYKKVCRNHNNLIFMYNSQNGKRQFRSKN